MKKKDNRSALKNIEILKNERRLLEAELTKRQDEYYALLKKYGKKPVYYAPDYDDMKEQGFGLDVCWFNPAGRPAPSPAPTQEIRSLRELLPLL